MIRFLQTPGKLKKIILGALLMLIAVTMVITLIPGGFLGDDYSVGTRGVLAQVGSEEVTLTEVDQRAQRVRSARNLPAQLMPFLRQQVAEALVTEKAMLVEARRLGLQVTQEELRDELINGPIGRQLFPDGRIDQERYADWVSQYARMSIPEFEAMLRQELLLNKLRALVEEGVSVTDADIQQEYQRQNTKVKLDYVLVSPEALSRDIRLTEAELRAYYEANKDGRYKGAIPEKRKAKYVVVDTARLAQQVQVSREELQRYYNENRDQYRIQEEVNVRHILVKTPPPGPDGKTDPAALEAARKKATDILQQVRAGADFAQLARKHSDDPGSKDNGGSLGWIQRGRTVPEFEQAAFSLEKGQVSDLVQSSFGFHIIRLDDRHQARIQSLDEVRAQIEPVLRQQQVAARAEQLARNLENEAHRSTLEAAAAKHGLSVIETEFFTRSDALPGLGFVPQFQEAVFSAAEKSPVASVSIPQGYVVYRVTEVKPAATPGFEEIRARVESEMKQERAAALVRQRTQELSDRARAEHSLKKAAAELGLTLRTSDVVAPEAQVSGLGSMSGDLLQAFTMKPGEISGPAGAGGNGVVFSVVEKHEPSLAEMERSRERIREELLERKRQMVLGLFAENLRERMQKEGKIRYNKQEQERLSKQTAGS